MESADWELGRECGQHSKALQQPSQEVSGTLCPGLGEQRGNTGEAWGGAPLNKALEELGLKLGVQAFYRSREVVMMTIARLTAALTVPTTHPHLIRSQILAVWTC